MVKKLKQHSGGAAEGQLAQAVRESAQQIWLAGLGAFAKAEAEGMKAFEKLVRDGKSLQARTTRVAGEKVAEAAAKASGTWDKLEQVFEDRVARSLGRLGVPSKQDIDTLAKRVAELTAAVQEKQRVTVKPAVAKASKVSKPRKVSKATKAVRAPRAATATKAKPAAAKR